MNKRMESFLAKAADKITLLRLPNASQQQIKVMRKNTIAYLREHGPETNGERLLWDALELSCAESPQPAVEADAQIRCEVCGDVIDYISCAICHAS